MMNKQRKAAAGAVLLASLALQARADAAQVNVSAAAFHTQIAGGDSIRYFGNLAVNWTGGMLTMIAALPRVPGGTGVTVFVDGVAVTGTYTCTVSSSVASRTFTVSSVAASWTRSVNFAAADIPSSSYLSIECKVPADGGIRGVTVTG